MARRTIVVGQDGSAGSEAAMHWCAEIALSLESEVIAVYALPPLMFVVPPAGTGAPMYADEDKIRSGLADALEDWCSPLREHGVPYRSRLVDGVAAEALMRVAAEVHADLLVVGRRGHGGFSEMVLGSVPHTLSHHADVPLVIVPAPG